MSGCSSLESTLTWITATSVDASAPTSVAFAVVPSSILTLIEVAPSTTWSLVTMSPFVSIMKPVPWAWTSRPTRRRTGRSRCCRSSPKW